MITGRLNSAAQRGATACCAVKCRRGWAVPPMPTNGTASPIHRFPEADGSRKPAHFMGRYKSMNSMSGHRLYMYANANADSGKRRDRHRRTLNIPLRAKRTHWSLPVPHKILRQGSKLADNLIGASNRTPQAYLLTVK